MVSVEEFPISTANDIPGFRIVETKGFIYGLTVRSRGAGGQIGAGVKSLFGGEIKQYVTMMEESRDEALNRAIEHARDLGANGIVAIRFDSNEISQENHFGLWSIHGGTLLWSQIQTLFG